MLDTLSQISWVLAGFAIGYALRRFAIAKDADAAFLFKLVFYVCVPALVFISLATVDLSQHLLIFSLLASVLYVAGYGVGLLVVRRLHLPTAQRAVFLISSMALNSLFAVPFLYSLFGSEGVARYIAFDLANTILLYGWAYAVAVRGNPHHHGMSGVVAQKLLRSPPLYAIALGIVVNVADWDIPGFLATTASTFSAPTGFLVTLATGIALTPRRSDVPTALRVIAVRLGTALVIGGGVIAVFDLHGIDRTAVLLFCVAPLAFSSVTFASLENLDVRFAAGSLSISLVIGIVLSSVVALSYKSDDFYVSDGETVTVTEMIVDGWAFPTLPEFLAQVDSIVEVQVVGTDDIADEAKPSPKSEGYLPADGADLLYGTIDFEVLTVMKGDATDRRITVAYESGKRESESGTRRMMYRYEGLDEVQHDNAKLKSPSELRGKRFVLFSNKNGHLPFVGDAHVLAHPSGIAVINDDGSLHFGGGSGAAPVTQGDGRLTLADLRAALNSPTVGG